MKCLMLAVFGLWLGTGFAAAHSWYPKTCCDDRDCRPIDRLLHNEDGTYEVWIGEILLIVPRGFPVQQSQDNEAHICFVPDFYSGEPDIVCMFMPSTS